MGQRGMETAGAARPALGSAAAADQRLGADESPAEQSIRQTNALVQTALWCINV